MDHLENQIRVSDYLRFDRTELIFPQLKLTVTKNDSRLKISRTPSYTSISETFLRTVLGYLLSSSQRVD